MAVRTRDSSEMTEVPGKLFCSSARMSRDGLNYIATEPVPWSVGFFKLLSYAFDELLISGTGFFSLFLTGSGG
jgi:hypothetical protein